MKLEKSQIPVDQEAWILVTNSITIPLNPKLMHTKCDHPSDNPQQTLQNYKPSPKK